jgi:glyoxylase-like metal-dependent hydrolase (beta-lactamase superfamily II)
MKHGLSVLSLLTLTVVTVFAQNLSPNPNPLSVERLRGNVYIIHQNLAESLNAGYMPTKQSNNVVFVDACGVLLVDNDDPKICSPEKFHAALAGIPGVKCGKVDRLINTHWHYDHTGMNDLFGKEGTEIIAHWNCSEIMPDPPVIRDVANTAPAPLPPAAMPTRFVALHRTTLQYKNEIVEILPYLGGHSNTDVAVFFKKANIICLGDLQSGHWFPFIDRSSGGSLKSCIRILHEIDAEVINDQTLIVPGHGIVINRVQFRDYISAMEDSLQKVQGLSVRA